MERTPEDRSEGNDRSEARDEPKEAKVPDQDESETWPPATETTEEPAAPAQDQPTEVTSRRRRTAGAILIVLGVVFLLDNYFDIGDWARLWPLLLILLGIVLIARSRKA